MFARPSTNMIVWMAPALLMRPLPSVRVLSTTYSFVNSSDGTAVHAGHVSSARRRTSASVATSTRHVDGSTLRKRKSRV